MDLLMLVFFLIGQHSTYGWLCWLSFVIYINTFCSSGWAAAGGAVCGGRDAFGRSSRQPSLGGSWPGSLLCLSGQLCCWAGRHRWQPDPEVRPQEKRVEISHAAGPPPTDLSLSHSQPCHTTHYSAHHGCGVTCPEQSELLCRMMQHLTFS